MTSSSKQDWCFLYCLQAHRACMKRSWRGIYLSYLTAGSLWELNAVSETIGEFGFSVEQIAFFEAYGRFPGSVNHNLIFAGEFRVSGLKLIFDWCALGRYRSAALTNAI